jgi:hypothetical protein
VVNLLVEKLLTLSWYGSTMRREVLTDLRRVIGVEKQTLNKEAKRAFM